jgi:hypothetical protein
MRTVARLGIAAVALAVVAGTSGCAAGGRDAGTGRAKSQAASADARVLSAGRELARCVRDNGMPQYADPTVADGRLRLPRVQLSRQALQACRPILDRLPTTRFGNGSGAPRSAEDLATLRRWARCAREHGLAGSPDPDPDGSFVIRGTPLEHVPEQALNRVVDACKDFSTPGVSVIL